MCAQMALTADGSDLFAVAVGLVGGWWCANGIVATFGTLNDEPNTAGDSLESDSDSIAFAAVLLRVRGDLALGVWHAMLVLVNGNSTRIVQSESCCASRSGSRLA
jgi:hypothetical protein